MNKIKLASPIRKTLLLLGWLLIFAFLISCFSYRIQPEQFKGITYFALSFPLLLLAMIAWCFTAAFLYKKGWLFFLLLLPAWKNISNTIALQTASPFVSETKRNNLRILSWNVNEFLIGHNNDPIWQAKQNKMIFFIKKSNADILCFQDFVKSPPNEHRNIEKYISDSLHYPYYYFSEDGISYGTIIYSRFPILNAGRIKYTEKVYPESLAYIDVQVNNQPIRIYNTHLRSMYLHFADLNINNIGYPEFVKEDTAFLFHSTRMERLEYFDRIHHAQSRIIKAQLDKTTTPFVFCADLNSVPTSYVYNLIRHGLQDAFLQKGSGMNGTYKKLNPLLRIDYILASQQINILQYHSSPLKLSDHFPILTDLQIGK